MYRLHPYQNSDGSWDYSCGLNSYYHWPMIEKIVAKTVDEKEILEYCYGVYTKRPGAFYAYYKRNGYLNNSGVWIFPKKRFYLTD